MGAYSPAPVLTPALEAEVMERIVRPTVKALAAEGTPYVGVLFAGLMLTDEGPKLIEYNCRSEEHTSELQSLMRISYAVFCLKKKTYTKSRSEQVNPSHNE